MSDQPFVDYYELLEASPNASEQTIERLFRLLAKDIHPDAQGTGDAQKFTELVEAYHTLKDPPTRTEYDIEYYRQRKIDQELVHESASADTDTMERHKMLSLFYARRRQDMKSPGLAGTTVETLMGASREVVEFHLWYFMKKGWVGREEGGTISITAEGVDRIDEMNLAYATATLPRMTRSPDHIAEPAFA
jgi:curved DNA-binding protein